MTALLVYELFGGDLLKTPLSAGDHFYNRIGGNRYDFTASQFRDAIEYMDLPTSPADAEQGATQAQLAALRATFQRLRVEIGLGDRHEIASVLSKAW
ncbi:YunG family protein [Bradyrhizobium oligotrophicum S58]